jgi:hypothetical protein
LYFLQTLKKWQWPGAKQAAEKGLDLIRTPEKHPSGPKGPADFAALTARLKSCPDTKRLFETHSTSFFAACKALTYQSCPDTKHRFSGAKASVDSVGFMRGLKPPPPSELSFFAACNGSASTPESSIYKDRITPIAEIS